MFKSQKPVDQNQNKAFTKAFENNNEDFILTIENGLAKWKPKYYQKSTVSTTNATTTTIQTIPVATGQGMLITTRVLSRKTSGAGVGTTGDVNAYVRTAKVKNVGGTVTAGSTSADFTSEDISQFNVTIVVSGTNILIRVDGSANNNVDWTATTYIDTI
jgi:non-canonical (house-cleaning) NTP pyrophosphatase